MTTHLSTVTNTDRPLQFRELTFLEEGEQVVIGRSDVDSYAVFPPDGAALVRRLADGTPPKDAAAWYEQSYGETVDIDDLLATLAALELLAPPGEEPTPSAVAVAGQRVGRILFSAPALVICSAVVAFAVVVVA